MTILATLAALLAVVGVYGVVAFTVRSRRHELGVRVALGGTQPGILIGSAVVLAAGRYLDPTLFRGGTRDPSVLGAVALSLAVTGLVASALPAFRATRVDPVEVLLPE
jgi:ABC-type antimicrobial peptide transport system permease subunit